MPKFSPFFELQAPKSRRRKRPRKSRAEHLEAAASGKGWWVHRAPLSRAPTHRTCRRRTGTWRSCESASATAPRRTTRRTGQVRRIARPEPRTRTGGCLPSPSPAGPPRAARAMTPTPARGRGARSSDWFPAAGPWAARSPPGALTTSRTPWPKTTR